MAVRLVEVIHSPTHRESLEAALGALNPIDWWMLPGQGQRMTTRVVLDAGDVEVLTDTLNRTLGGGTGWRILIAPVDAVLPRPPDPETAQATVKSSRPVGRISREQLFAQVSDSLNVNAAFLVMAALSALVAAIGLLKDNVAIVIGAMVLAPLLAPNIGLALATTLGDLALARRALRANATGMGLAALVAVAVGLMFHPSPAHPEIVSRTSVDYGDLALALCAGVAATLSMTTALSANLIGVMVAVAMMPPLVAAGLMAGARHWPSALGALLLLAINIIAVNLAAVGTFLAQGVLPAQWWKQRQTRRATWRAIGAWALLLGLLALAIHFADFQPHVSLP